LKSAVLARMVGAARTIGLPRAHLREPQARFFYTDTADLGAATHVIHKGLSLLRALDVTTTAVHFPLRVPQGGIGAGVAKQFGADGYALLNPGAAWPNKRWPAVRFGAVAAAVRRDHGLRSVVMWGPGEQAAGRCCGRSVGWRGRGGAANDHRGYGGDRARDAADGVGRYGPLHVAGAVGTPLVALFGPTLPERNGPWATNDVTLSRVASCSCFYERRCKKVAPCIDDITVDEVVEAVRRRLGVHE
jgi:ADP-heptose:LPS heptosyltransferase